MNVRFWGVRGSIAVSGADFAATGGNTSCVAVEAEGHLMVLDGGTGLRALGASLGFVPVNMTICFSHVHWDHIQGVPFFAPFFHPGSRVRVLGARRDGSGVREALAAQMRPPTFPITLDALRARLEFEDVNPGATLEIGPFKVSTCEVPHPDGAMSWRVEERTRAFVYATDVEHAAAPDARFLRFCEGAGLLAHDAQYTDEEYARSRGWGHSTWRTAVDVARQAGVERLALFHHDPTRNDAGVAQLEAFASRERAGVFAAREGLRVAL